MESDSAKKKDYQRAEGRRSRRLDQGYLSPVRDFLADILPVAPSINGNRVTCVLDSLAWSLGLPEEIVVVNGSEFTSLAMDQWAHRNGVSLHFIDPGKPNQTRSSRASTGIFGTSV